MKKRSFGIEHIFYQVLLVGFLISLAFLQGVAYRNQARAATTCQPTGYMQDSQNLTAAVVVTKFQQVSNTTIDASSTGTGTTPCDIGVYFGPGSFGSVTNSTISGATYYGVLNNGGRVTVTKSTIKDIGDTPFSGISSHGFGIYFLSSSDGHPASGDITRNTVSQYQKNGIVVRGSTASVQITSNQVTGDGPTTRIAQNGIEIGLGASAQVYRNTVTGNSYTGQNNAVDGGILVYGGSLYGGPVTTRTIITNNTLKGNDVGVYLSNLDGSGSTYTPTTTPTRIVVNQNVISNDAITNATGATFNLPTPQYYPYQAGISDQGNSDSMVSNRICGTGYTPTSSTPPPFLYTIDITNTLNPTVINNTSCTANTTISPDQLARRQKSAKMRVQVHAAV